MKNLKPEILKKSISLFFISSLFFIFIVKIMAV